MNQKSDLLNMDNVFVELRNKTICKKENNVIYNHNTLFDIENSYKEDLKNKTSSAFDIIKIYKIEEEKSIELLTEKEKKYLSAVIKPFRDKILSIEKVVIIVIAKPYDDYTKEYLDAIRINFNNYIMTLPPFKKDLMYKNMAPYDKYTLEDLGL